VAQPPSSTEDARAHARRVALPLYPEPDTIPRKASREEAFAASREAGRRAPLAAATAMGTLMDSMLDLLLKDGPSPACRRGCGWCCHVAYVTVTAPEAILAVEWARTHFTKDELDALRKRAKQNAKRTKGRGPASYPRQACAFLVNDECSVHPARPANCRTAFSLDVRSCIASYHAHDSSLEVPLPIRGDALAHGQEIIKGYKEALEHAKSDARAYELQQAVHLLLKDPSAASRWVAGDRDVLRAARARP
jgi:Fe-S-cluster containining protein